MMGSFSPVANLAWKTVGGFFQAENSTHFIFNLEKSGVVFLPKLSTRNFPTANSHPQDLAKDFACGGFFRQNSRREISNWKMNERVIFIEKDDEIDVLVSVLNRTKADRIVFVVPRKAVFLQTIFNAKILRTTAEELGKWIFIVTRDKTGRQMLDTAGLANFETLEEFSATEVDKVFAKGGAKKPGKKKAIRQIGETNFTAERISKESAPDESEKINWKEILLRPSKTLILLLTVLAVSLFFFVSALALPGATVLIKPERRTTQTTMNLVLVESKKLENVSSWRLKNVITGLPVEANFEKSITFATLTQEFFGQRASGEIVIQNASGQSQSFRPTTRFQSSEGIVFRTQDWVRIPPRQGEKNGEKVVRVIADEKNIFGEIIGEQGNLPAGEKLKIPGLPPESQKFLWGEVRQDLSGGESRWQPRVTQKDFVMAQKVLEEKLIEEVQSDLENFLKEKNSFEFSNLTLVPDSNFLKKEIFDVVLPEDILGQNVESFEISGKIHVRSWAFDRDELVDALEKVLKKSIDPQMQLEKITPSSIAVEVLEKENQDGLKINVRANGVQKFLIVPETAESMKFEEKVKSAILEKDPETAEKVLVNFKEISDVQITLWPFFARKVPALRENIAIKVWEE